MEKLKEKKDPQSELNRLIEERHASPKKKPSSTGLYCFAKN